MNNLTFYELGRLHRPQLVEHMQTLAERLPQHETTLRALIQVLQVRGTLTNKNLSWVSSLFALLEGDVMSTCAASKLKESIKEERQQNKILQQRNQKLEKKNKELEHSTHFILNQNEIQRLETRMQVRDDAYCAEIKRIRNNNNSLQARVLELREELDKTEIKIKIKEVDPSTERLDWLLRNELKNSAYLTDILTHVMKDPNTFSLAFAKAQLRIMLSAEEILHGGDTKTSGEEPRNTGTDPSDNEFRNLIENNLEHHWFLKTWVKLCNASYVIEQRNGEWGVLSLYNGKFTICDDKPHALKKELHLKKAKARDHILRLKTRFQEPTEQELLHKFRKVIKKYDIDLQSLKELN